MPVQNRPHKEDDILVFEPFVRTKFPILICLFGFSGCGKTKSAILLAQGLGGKTAFLDTETGRGRVYAEDAVGMTYTEMTPPFTPERYMAAIRQIEKAGFDNLIIDSGSHEWDGLGGMLEIADTNVDSTGKKRTGLGKWSVKSRHKSFMNTMMAGRMNIIICLRAKDKFVEATVDGKNTVVNSGFVPLQERNFKYDMMIQLPMPEDGEGCYMMDRLKGFKAPGALLPSFKEGAKVTRELGIQISEWISTGQPVDELLRQLRQAAAEEAESGVEHFRAYWKELPREQQIKLKPFLPNFESIARVADLENHDEDAVVKPIAPTVNLDALKAGVASDASMSFGADAAQKTVQDASKGIHAPIVDFNATIPRERKIEDADWWGIFDDICAHLVACKNAKNYSDFHITYEKEIDSLLTKAPDNISHAYRVVEQTITLKLHKAAS